MIVEVLAADARATMSVRIVAPGHYASIREVLGEEVAEPVDAVACRPRFVAMPVEAMDSNDVDDRIDALRYYLQALGNFGVGLGRR